MQCAHGVEITSFSGLPRLISCPLQFMSAQQKASSQAHVIVRELELKASYLFLYIL